MEDDLLTVPELAKELGISPDPIRQAIREGKLPAYCFGRRWNRVYRSDGHKWVRRNPVETPMARGRRRAREE